MEVTAPSSSPTTSGSFSDFTEGRGGALGGAPVLRPRTPLLGQAGLAPCLEGADRLRAAKAAARPRAYTQTGDRPRHPHIFLWRRRAGKDGTKRLATAAWQQHGLLGDTYVGGCILGGCETRWIFSTLIDRCRRLS